MASPPSTSSIYGPWVVLKFGGTSVSTVERWQTIADETRQRLVEGLRPLVVCSALSGISNLLERVVREAPRGQFGPILAEIEALHRSLALALRVDFEVLLREELDEVARLALGASLLREASPRVQARIMAAGELMATRLGAAFLANQGIGVAWLDARELLVAEPEPHVPESRRWLSATCRFERDALLGATLGARSEAVLLTQGFIARDTEGNTILLGRGGSDTSAAYFAARLGAVRCEIWTDVPGMYSGNPRQVSQARLLRSLDYDEAQEIASMGAKVLHPRCIPPVRSHGIPMHIRCTQDPAAEGTVIHTRPGRPTAQVKCVSARSGLTLVSMDTTAMWQQVGFLADVFAVFKRHGLSIDLVSTSESNVTVSLDPSANALNTTILSALIQDLCLHCDAKAIGPCAAVSLVGQGIRALLHRLGPALEAFEEQRIYLVSQAASDLNLSFVVDEDQAERLVRVLHQQLLESVPDDDVFGPSLPANASPTSCATPWWVAKREALHAAASRGTPRYIYDVETLDETASALCGLTAIDRVYYAVKANPHPVVLERAFAAGCGFECVSPGEIDRVLTLFPAIPPERILFTPNFAPREEYERALALGVLVTLDNLHPLEHWPEIFRDRAVLVRLDPGLGRGHHRHVHTGGVGSKFGVDREDIDRLAELAATARAHVVGLHAHVGSGIRDAQAWVETALFLSEAAGRFPEVEVLDLGGGLGVVEKAGQGPLDLEAMNALLMVFRQAHPNFSLWIEPGRYLVAHAGVLIARVTQLKRKGSVTWVGVDVGMNSLIRPALYGAHHEIVNLTRLDEPATEWVHVVGPICESGDVLGWSRRLPPTEEGDVLLIATTGAYGRSMASSYNLREPATELALY